MVILNLSKEMNKTEWLQNTYDSIYAVLKHTYGVSNDAMYDMRVTFVLEINKNSNLDYNIDMALEDLNNHLSNINVLKGEYGSNHIKYMNKLGTLLGRLCKVA